MSEPLKGAAAIFEQLWRVSEKECEELRAEVERLRAALADARDALRNDFEPDNQSRAWHRANDALKAT